MHLEFRAFPSTVSLGIWMTVMFGYYDLVISFILPLCWALDPAQGFG